MYGRAFCCCSIAVLSGLLSIASQSDIFGLSTGEGTERPSPQTSFSVTRNVVLLNVSVRRSDGTPVTGLTRDDFLVYEEEQEQEIGFFQEQNSPVQIMLLLDTSSSMKGGPLNEAVRAALEMISRIPKGQIALMTFSHRPQLVKEFSRDQQELHRAVKKTDASGGTAFYDAILQALAEFRPANNQRQILVLLSDGKDEDSFSRYREVEREVQSSLITIYSIGEYSESERIVYQEQGKYYRQPEFDANLNPIWILDQLSTLTGGLSFFPRTGENLTPILKKVFEDLESQYQLGYEPGPSDPPGFRRIEVRLRETERFGNVRVRTRTGYRAD